MPNPSVEELSVRNSSRLPPPGQPSRVAAQGSCKTPPTMRLLIFTPGSTTGATDLSAKELGRAHTRR
eukprot:15435071-Alexandrium_andersonii.AAC.1